VTLGKDLLHRLLFVFYWQHSHLFQGGDYIVLNSGLPRMTERPSCTSQQAATPNLHSSPLVTTFASSTELHKYFAKAEPTGTSSYIPNNSHSRGFIVSSSQATDATQLSPITSRSLTESEQSSHTRAVCPWSTLPSLPPTSLLILIEV